MTEYAGFSLDKLDKITRTQMESALEALSVLHDDCGILHGKVSLSNIVWSDKLQRAMWIGLGHCKYCPQSGKDANGWREQVNAEHHRVEKRLKAKQKHKEHQT